MTQSVALVHDYLLVQRGAERTFAAMAECWPEAPIYTLLYDEEGTGGIFAGRDIHTSYLQRLGVDQRRFRSLLPAFPRAIRSLPLDGYDLVVSSSSAFAHTVVTSDHAIHACYCHTPFRYAWFERDRALGEVPFLLRPALNHVLWRTREADRSAARRVTHYIANSKITRERIRRHWKRDASIVRPPVEVERFVPGGASKPFFLVVTELVRHKRVEIALEAAARAGVDIRIVGEGPDRERLEGRYRGTARFLGRVDDDELATLYAQAQALVMPNVEEFGITAVEAQAAGTPVVAAAAGGALETVIHGQTGFLVEPESVDSLARCLSDPRFSHFDPVRLSAHARSFSKATFQRRLRKEVELCAEQGSSIADEAVGPSMFR